MLDVSRETCPSECPTEVSRETCLSREIFLDNRNHCARQTSMSRAIAIANQKGGVGKTTTAVNLAASLATFGDRVLVIDVDPQGNATSGLGIDKTNLEKSLYDVFCEGESLENVICATELPTLYVAPSNTDLVAAEVELINKQGRETVLSREIEALSVGYDYIFFDCPPSLGILTINALVAADSILVPLQCEYYALEGISSLMQTVELAKEQVNPKLELEGVILTMHDGRTNLSRQVEEEARNFFAEAVFECVIPRNVRLSESPSFGRPICLYEPQSVGAGAYLAVAKELKTRRGEKVTKSRKANKKASKKKRAGGRR